MCYIPDPEDEISPEYPDDDSQGNPDVLPGDPRCMVVSIIHGCIDYNTFMLTSHF